jgi:uncharacterized protein (DUF1919 family)
MVVDTDLTRLDYRPYKRKMYLVDAARIAVSTTFYIKGIKYHVDEGAYVVVDCKGKNKIYKKEDFEKEFEYIGGHPINASTKEQRVDQLKKKKK